MKEDNSETSDTESKIEEDSAENDMKDENLKLSVSELNAEFTLFFLKQKCNF